MDWNFGNYVPNSNQNEARVVSERRKEFIDFFKGQYDTLGTSRRSNLMRIRFILENRDFYDMLTNSLNTVKQMKENMEIFERWKNDEGLEGKYQRKQSIEKMHEFLKIFFDFFREYGESYPQTHSICIGIAEVVLGIKTSALYGVLGVHTIDNLSQKTDYTLRQYIPRSVK